MPSGLIVPMDNRCFPVLPDKVHTVFYIHMFMIGSRVQIYPVTERRVIYRCLNRPSLINMISYTSIIGGLFRHFIICFIIYFKILNSIHPVYQIVISCFKIRDIGRRHFFRVLTIRRNKINAPGPYYLIP